MTVQVPVTRIVNYSRDMAKVSPVAKKSGDTPVTRIVNDFGHVTGVTGVTGKKCNPVNFF